MSSTQEKLIMEIVDEICDYDEYCGDENCKQCGGPIKFWKKKLTALIDSAKREGAIEEMKKTDDVFSAMHQGTPGAGWVHYGEFGEYIDDRIAQFEQSEESI